ncbi:MAG: MarR family transcriptional regulator [Leptospiraceae bacterium]|nr:MarR family transcriptional regulator [Leptospiraceae bacterium]
MKKEIVPPNQDVQDKIFKKIQSEIKNPNLAVLNFISEIILFSSTINTSFDLYFSRFNLSQPGFLTLMILYSESEIPWTANLLSKELGVKPPTMTGILDTLAKNDLIERIPSENDRRVTNIVLSKSGKDQLKKILPEHVSNISHSFGWYETKSHKQISKHLELILNSMSQLISRQGK